MLFHLFSKLKLPHLLFLGDKLPSLCRFGHYWWLISSTILLGTWSLWNYQVSSAPGLASLSKRYFESDNRNEPKSCLLGKLFLISWQNALLSAVPFFTNWLFTIFYSGNLDRAITKQWITRTTARKLSQLIGKIINNAEIILFYWRVTTSRAPH